MKPLTPKSLIRRRASRTPASPRWGLMLANGIATSAFLCASSAISSLVILRLAPFSPSTVKTTKAILSLRYISAISGTVWCCG